jgi:hypothetical protein
MTELGAPAVQRTVSTIAQRVGRGAKPRRNDVLVLVGLIDVSHCRMDAYDKPASPAPGGYQITMVAKRGCGAAA